MKWSPLKILTCVVVGVLLLVLMIKQVVEHNTDDNDPVLAKLKTDIEIIEPGVKNTVFHKGEKSYTINKKHIYMCLKDENGDYYDPNTLMYVALHELAHTFCDSVGHTPDFSRIFHNLLERAERVGLYDSSQKITENYCEYNDEK